MSAKNTQILLHIIFSTKERRPIIHSDWEERLQRYMNGIVHGQRSTLVAVGGMPDHVHLLVRLHPDVAVSALVREVKSESSRWAHEHIPEARGFQWQRGYAAFSVSVSIKAKVMKYIREQKKHHAGQGQSFEEEARALIERHELQFDVAHPDV